MNIRLNQNTTDIWTNLLFIILKLTFLNTINIKKKIPENVIIISGIAGPVIKNNGNKINKIIKN